MESAASARQQHGFTFIEVLVAVGIFAVVSTICFATASQYLTVREAIDENQRDLRNLQRAFTMMERDLRFMVDRPVRDGYGDVEASWLPGDGSISGELFRLTVSEPDASVLGNTRLTRVAWRMVDGDLYRDNWLVLDQVQDSEPFSRLMLRNVSDVAFQTFSWDDQLGVQQSLDAAAQGLPYALEVNLILDDDRKYRKVFDLANGS